MSYHQVLVPAETPKSIGDMYLVHTQDKVCILKGSIPRDSLIPSLEAFRKLYKANVAIMSALPQGYKKA